MGVATVAREHRRPSTSTTTTAPPQTATAPPLRHAPQQSARRSTTTTAPQPSLTPRNLHIRPSLCGTFTVVAEDYSVPLLKDANGGALPMDRRCTVKVYERAQSAKAAVLLVHGFASNRTMFDAGGGKGRDGPSFFEFLAQRNYDAFAIDLRGTRESLRRGARAPAYVKEHIEIDVPSAIAAIKRIGHEKVYLIGHSMGGAISCAVAGHIPHDVAGVVHLAGLYHLTLPILGDAVDLYRATVPRVVQSIVSSSSGFALRSFIQLFNPAISSALGLLSPEPSSDAPPVGILHPAAQSSLPTLGAAASVRYAATYIRRQIIPVRSIVDSMLFMRHFLPTTVSKALLNMLYPSPWLPYSVDDPASFVDLALESPTVGICVSMAKSAVHRDVFNAWLEDSSHHRAENPQSKAITSHGTNSHGTSSKTNPDSHGDLKSLRSQHSSPKSGSLSTSQQPTTPKIVIEDVSSDSSGDETDDSYISIKTSPTSKGLPSIAQKDAGLAIKRDISNQVKIHYSPYHGWDELGPYLDQFERLQHLPLFFCPANADAILRTEDTVAGYIRSGSKWKEIIEYRDVKPRSNSNRSSTTTTTTQEPTIGALMEESEYLTASEQDPTTPPIVSPDRLKRVSSGSSFVKSSLYNPSSSTTTPHIPAFEIEDDDPQNRMKPRYSVPASLKYGHCDILGGKHAEQVWQKIVDWLDVTTAREREWRFRRRYSAK